MKSKVSVIIGSLVTAMVLSTAVQTLAMPIPQVGDKVTITAGANRAGAGGEFILKDKDNADKFEYISFCLEKYEYISLDSSYYVHDVSQFALSNPDSGPYSGGSYGGFNDQISNATKWLMNEYIFGDLSSFGSESVLSELVQSTIWYFEHEINSYNYDFKNFVYTNSGFTRNDHDSSFMPHVMVVNLWNSENGGFAQSQLIATNPVPEPATMLLFGAGLAGLAGIARRRKQEN